MLCFGGSVSEPVTFDGCKEYQMVCFGGSVNEQVTFEGCKEYILKNTNPEEVGKLLNISKTRIDQLNASNFPKLKDEYQFDSKDIHPENYLHADNVLEEESTEELSPVENNFKQLEKPESETSSISIKDPLPATRQQSLKSARTSDTETQIISYFTMNSINGNITYGQTQDLFLSVDELSYSESKNFELLLQVVSQHLKLDDLLKMFKRQIDAEDFRTFFHPDFEADMKDFIEESKYKRNKFPTNDIGKLMHEFNFESPLGEDIPAKYNRVSLSMMNKLIELHTQHENRKNFLGILKDEKQMKELFEEIDDDNSGTLEKSELQDALKMLGLEVTRKTMNEIFGGRNVKSVDYYQFKNIVSMSIQLQITTVH
jgi:hypothetical protein